VESLGVEGSDAAWSPTGDLIAYHGFDGVGYTKPDTVWLYSLKERNTRRVAPGGFPHWSRDGKKLYFFSADRMQLMQWVLSEDSAKPTPVVERHIPHRNAVLSPDGTRIAWWKRDLCRFVVTEVGNETEQAAVPWSAPSAVPDFSPDGSRIALGGCCSHGTLPGLWIIDVNTNNFQKLLDGDFSYPKWSPDGRWLACHQTSANRTLIIDTAELPMELRPRFSQTSGCLRRTENLEAVTPELSRFRSDTSMRITRAVKMRHT
jgi:Tol biopolymer transport system component